MVRSTLTVIDPAATHDLTTIETLKAEMEISGATDDAFLGALIRQASDQIRQYTNRTFAQETVKERFDFEWLINNDEHWSSSLCHPLRLARAPITDVIEIIDDGNVIVPPDEYDIDAENGLIWRISDGLRFGWFSTRLEVTYTAGYALLSGLPYDIERAAIDLIKRHYYSRSRDPALRSEQILDVINSSWTAASSASTKFGMPVDIAERLDPHRRFC